MSIKISELPQATSVGSSDIVPIVQGGTTKQATAGMIQPTIEMAVAKLNTEKTINIATTGSVNGTIWSFDYLDKNYGSVFSLTNEGKIKISKSALIQIDGYANPFSIGNSNTFSLGIVYYYYRNGTRNKIDGISQTANQDTEALQLCGIITEVQADDEICAGLFSSSVKNNIKLGSATLTIRVLKEL